MATVSKADSLQGKHHHEIKQFLKSLQGDQLISLGTALGLDYNRLRNKEAEHLLGDLISGWLNMDDYVEEASGIPCWTSLIKALEEEGHRGMANKIRENKIQGLPGNFVNSTHSCQNQSGYPTSQRRDETTSSLSSIAGEKRQRCLERAPDNTNMAARKVAQYQHLNIEHLTKEERDTFIGQLEEDSKQIRSKFAGLLHDTSESLTSYNIPLKRVILLLDSFNIPELSQCMDVNEVLIKTKPYRSFFNYEIIELLIEKIGDDHDKARLEAYKLEFEKYCKHRLCEVPTDALESDSTALAKVCVKTDKTFDVPLKDIKSVTVRLSKLLNIHLILRNISEGCVELEIDCLREDNFLLFQNKDHADTFAQISIIKIYNDKGVFFEHEDKKIDVKKNEEKVKTHLPHPSTPQSHFVHYTETKTFLGDDEGGAVAYQMVNYTMEDHPRSYESEASPGTVKRIIRDAMAEKGITKAEIPQEYEFSSPGDALCSKRYFEVKGFAWYSCPKRHNRWSSAYSWCCIDLKKQRICYRNKQNCKKCESEVDPEFTQESVKRMAECAVKRYLIKTGELDNVFNPSIDDGDRDVQGGGSHDEERCGKCKRLGRSCWK